MPTSSGLPPEKARKAFTRVLQALSEPGTQRNLAQITGMSEAAVSRLKTDHLEDTVVLLTHLGFSIVPPGMRCYPEEYVQALHTMARLQMQNAAPTLEWDT